MKRLVPGCTFAAGCSFLLVAVICLLGIILSTPPESATPSILLVIFFVVFPLGVSALLFYHYAHAMKTRVQHAVPSTPARNLQQEILALAHTTDGNLTLAEIVMKLSVEPSAAEKELNEMVIQGLARTEVQENGRILYHIFERDELTASNLPVKEE